MPVRSTTRSASAPSRRWSSACACTDRPHAGRGTCSRSRRCCSSEATCSPTTTRRSSAVRCRRSRSRMSSTSRATRSPAAGLLLLIRSRSPGRDWASLIDAAIVTIGLGLLSVARADRAVGAQRGAPVGNEAGLDRLSPLGHPRARRRGAAGRRSGAPEPRLLHDRRSPRRRPRGRLGLWLEPAPRRLQPRNPAGRGLDRSAPAVRSRGASSLDDDRVAAGRNRAAAQRAGGWRRSPRRR